MNEYFSNEKDFLPNPNYMTTIQKDISNHMRAILNDWLLEVHLKYKFQHETIFLAVNLLDRYLSKVNIHRNILQLIGVSALMIAAKYEEIYPPDLKVYSYITDDAYNKDQVKFMETQILKVLNFDTTITSPMKFFYVLHKLMEFGQTASFFAEYLMDISILDVKMLKYLPSEIAATAVWMGIKVCENKDLLKEIATNARCKEETIKSCSEEFLHLIKKFEKEANRADHGTKSRDFIRYVNRFAFGYLF